MSKFTNPLDNIRVASPCSADWNEMFGNERRRFCAECKLNVYNLSDMSRQEAENLILSSEGRLCVRFYRRADGTVLTQDCPVGWRAAKQRISRAATAAFSMLVGLSTGILGFNLLQREPRPSALMDAVPAVTDQLVEVRSGPTVGEIEIKDSEIGDMVMGTPSIIPQYNTRQAKNK